MSATPQRPPQPQPAPSTKPAQPPPPPPSPSPSPYPVQPTFIVVREIQFISHRPPSKDDNIEGFPVRFSSTITPFDESTKRLQVTFGAEFGFQNDPSKPQPPFSLKVVMTGEFAIADDFPRDKIQLWATRNAPFVIFPYLRERLHYMSSQGGYPPIMLPLLQIPTLKIEQKNEMAKA
jgi:preprotein translocase subunit SecB